MKRAPTSRRAFPLRQQGSRQHRRLHSRAPCLLFVRLCSHCLVRLVGPRVYLSLCRAGSRVLVRRLCLARVRLGVRLESRAQTRRRRRAGSRPACPVEIRLVSLVQYHSLCRVLYPVAYHRLVQADSLLASPAVVLRRRRAGSQALVRALSLQVGLPVRHLVVQAPFHLWCL